MEKCCPFNIHHKSLQVLFSQIKRVISVFLRSVMNFEQGNYITQIFKHFSLSGNSYWTKLIDLHEQKETNIRIGLKFIHKILCTEFS